MNLSNCRLLDPVDGVAAALDGRRAEWAGKGLPDAVGTRVAMAWA
jgi:hypothetical protein